jgi:hypothetical protein
VFRKLKSPPPLFDDDFLTHAAFGRARFLRFNSCVRAHGRSFPADLKSSNEPRSPLRAIHRTCMRPICTENERWLLLLPALFIYDAARKISPVCNHQRT